MGSGHVRQAEDARRAPYGGTGCFKPHLPSARSPRPQRGAPDKSSGPCARGAAEGHSPRCGACSIPSQFAERETEKSPPLRAKPPDPRGVLPIRARDHVRGAQPKGSLRCAGPAPSQASSLRGRRRSHIPSARSPPTPEGRSRQELGTVCAGRSRGALRFLSQSAGAAMQGAPALRCGVRREGGLRSRVETDCQVPCGDSDRLTWF